MYTNLTNSLIRSKLYIDTKAKGLDNENTQSVRTHKAVLSLTAFLIKNAQKNFIILTLNFSIALSKNRQQYVFNRLVIQVCTSSEEAQNGVIISYVQII